MKISGHDFGGKRKKIKINNPVVEHGEDETLWQEIRKYMRLIPAVPEPNMGRIKEIKEEIRRGTYDKAEVLEETAARLAIRFMTKE